MNYRLTLISILLITLCAQNSPITSFVVTLREKHQQSCLIAVENTHEILDLRSNCQFSSESQGSSWKKLIISSKSYIVEENGLLWKGYRYFKNPLHYKNVTADLSLYQTLIQQILDENSFKTKLLFDDKYSILLNQDKDKKWKISHISIDYTFNPIQKINVNNDLYNVQVHSNKTSNIQQSFAIRKLSGKGLHQKVNLTLALDFQTSLQVDQTCKVIIGQILPESTYIDTDQLRSVKKMEVINIQLPEPASRQYYYQYTIPFAKFKESGSRRYNYLYPIHFRYPAPSHLNYTLVTLHPSDNIQLICGNGSKIVNLTEDPFNNRGYASIFNGSSHDTKTVSMITFVLMIIAAAIIIKQLRKI